jgi:predicted histone-like DNA-binding protein
MKYRLISRENPLDRNKSKWYANPVNNGKITKADLAKEIVNISALSRGDVSSVIENLLDVIPKYLLMGKSVYLGELGTLRISFSSEGVETQKEFNVNKITGVKIIFTPGVELKEDLRDIHFEREVEKNEPPATPPEDGKGEEG